MIGKKRIRLSGYIVIDVNQRYFESVERFIKRHKPYRRATARMLVYLEIERDLNRQYLDSLTRSGTGLLSDAFFGEVVANEKEQRTIKYQDVVNMWLGIQEHNSEQLNGGEIPPRGILTQDRLSEMKE